METKENRVTPTVEQAKEAVCVAASELGWNPCFTSHIKAVDFTGMYFEFENRTPLGLNFISNAIMEGVDIGSLLDDLDAEAKEFDIDEETMHYVTEEMLGRDGVPDSIDALHNDMEKKKAMLFDFARQMRMKLEHLTEVEDQNQN